MGGFHLILIHSETFGVNFTHIAGCLLACGSEQISLNCIYFQPNIRSVPIMNISIDPITVFPFEVDHQALNVSRD